MTEQRQRLCCPMCKGVVATAVPLATAAGYEFELRCQSRHCQGKPLLRYKVGRSGLAALRSLDRAPARVVA